MRKMTEEEFISRSSNKHSNKYNYSEVDLVNGSTKVKIICDTHGAFYQKPNEHLTGRGCPSCGGRKKLTKDTFIIKANEKHKNVYIYDGVVYMVISIKPQIIIYTEIIGYLVVMDVLFVKTNLNLLLKNL